MAITTGQIRGARGLLDWSQAELSRHTGISTTSIGNIESGHTQARESTMGTIRSVFERNGIEFIGMDGVRLQREFIKTYSGSQGFRDFMDHLYDVAKNTGGEFSLFNAHPEQWIKFLGEEWFKAHSERMHKLGNKINFKITAQEGEHNFISKEFAEYRWFPGDIFSKRALYAYADNIAFINFEDNDVTVTVLRQADFAKSFLVLFNIAWEKVAIPTNKI